MQKPVTYILASRSLSRRQGLGSAQRHKKAQVRLYLVSFVSNGTFILSCPPSVSSAQFNSPALQRSFVHRRTGRDPRRGHIHLSR